MITSVYSMYAKREEILYNLLMISIHARYMLEILYSTGWVERYMECE